MLKLLHDDLLARLKGLDEEVALTLDGDDRYYMIIVGGSALVLRRLRDTATHDIDVVSNSKELFPYLDKYDINTRVEAYINCFPYNFEDRVEMLHKGRRIDFYTVSLEDAVIAKLYAMRPQDALDISSEQVLGKLDWALLDKLATDSGEAQASALNERSYSIFLDAYADYARRHRPCVN